MDLRVRLGSARSKLRCRAWLAHARSVNWQDIGSLAEPSAGRAKALEQLKTTVEMVAGLGVDRMVCPCAASEKFVLDDYKRAQDNLREAGEIVKPYGAVAMLEFMRGSTFVGTLPTSLNLTRETAHPNIKSMFDFYHFWAGLSKFEDLDLIRRFVHAAKTAKQGSVSP